MNLMFEDCDADHAYYHWIWVKFTRISMEIPSKSRTNPNFKWYFAHYWTCRTTTPLCFMISLENTSSFNYPIPRSYFSTFFLCQIKCSNIICAHTNSDSLIWLQINLFTIKQNDFSMTFDLALRNVNKFDRSLYNIRYNWNITHIYHLWKM